MLHLEGSMTCAGSQVMLKDQINTTRLSQDDERHKRLPHQVEAARKDGTLERSTHQVEARLQNMIVHLG